MNAVFSIVKKLIRAFLWAVLAICPVKKNKVVLQSYYGRGYSDSPKAICDELLKRGGFEIFWVVKSLDADNKLPEKVKPVVYDSVAFIYHMRTAGFWIDNSRKWCYIKKKKSQFYIQTWHGFALKRIEGDAGDALPPDYIKAGKADSKKCDLFISDSEHMTEIYRRGFWYDKQILKVGLPRNDVLINCPREKIESIRAELGAKEGERFCLYAPTFRNDANLECYRIDYDALSEALSKRFGGSWTVLTKLHSNLEKYADELKLEGKNVRNLSRYPDIQNLYLVSDVLISDYSSVMFDYMLTKKPCFLFCTDLEDYKRDRNFYMPIESLPFELCLDNQMLISAVNGFDENDYKLRLESFTEKCGIVADGNASVAICDLMENILKK